MIACVVAVGSFLLGLGARAAWGQTATALPIVPLDPSAIGLLTQAILDRSWPLALAIVVLLSVGAARKYLWRELPPEIIPAATAVAGALAAAAGYVVVGGYTTWAALPVVQLVGVAVQGAVAGLAAVGLHQSGVQRRKRRAEAEKPAGKPPA